jgi:predicted negative regulator of RcsB-dependent stress response
MDPYRTEEEQIEAFKTWWRENGLAVMLGAVIGIGGLFGWNAWQTYEREQAAAASMTYDQLLPLLQAARYPEFDAAVQKLQNEYDRTPYATLGALMAAKAAVKRGNHESAQHFLQWAVTNAEQPEIAITAKLQLARLHLSANRPDEAAKLLNEQYPSAFLATVEDLKGDLHMLRGETEAARTAYQKALAAEVGSQLRQMIQIKLEQIAENAAAAGHPNA